MLPIRDDTPRSTTPFINYFLIALNIAIFAFEWIQGPRSLRELEFQFAFIPQHLGAWFSGSLPASYALVPFFSSMFLHASWPHVLANMWFLRIFGDNVEDRLGHFGYLIFYLLCGVGANLVHLIFNFTSPLPAVGRKRSDCRSDGGLFHSLSARPGSDVVDILCLLAAGLAGAGILVPGRIFEWRCFPLHFFRRRRRRGILGPRRRLRDRSVADQAPSGTKKCLCI